MKALFRLRVLLRPYLNQILFTFLCLIVVSAARLAVPSIIRRVIDVGLMLSDSRNIIQSALIVLGIGGITAVFSYGLSYTSESVAFHVAFDLRNRLFDRIQRLSFTYHDRAQTGQLISRCIEDVRSTQQFTGFGIVELARVFILLIGTVVLLFAENAHLAWIALLPMIPLFITTTRFGRQISNLFLSVDDILGELSSRLQENVLGAQLVRAFAQEVHEIERFDKTNRELYRARVHVVQEWSKIMPTTTLLISMSTILILWFGGKLVQSGDLTIGGLVAFNGYLLLLAAPAQQFAWLVNLAGEASAGIQRVFYVLDHEPEIKNPTDAIQAPPLKGHVQFEHVSFSYHGETTQAVNNINLDIQPNQMVALIGPTGSGKTTLVNLISRFYDVSAGCIRIDGFDVKDYDLVALRRQIGIVQQISLLFSSTIRENIAYGRSDAALDEIIAAAKAAQAHGFIQEMQAGYDTVVGERGVTLSGGQRQRIAIARALLLNPRILILDDSMSSVDTKTEHLIQKALVHLMQGRTTFVIAQRLSTVKRADCVLVMDKGQIVQSGRHEELILKDGLYQDIYNLQFRDQDQARQELDDVLNSSSPSDFGVS